MSLTDFISGFSETVIQICKALIPAAVTGLIVAYLTAKYALSRFYQEKLWEKKLAGFTEVTDLAYKMKRAQDYWLAEAEAQHFHDDQDQGPAFQALSKADEEKLRLEFVFALKEITRHSHLASLTLSDRAGEILKQFVKDYDEIYPSWWQDELDTLEAQQRSQSLSENLLADLINEAKVSIKFLEINGGGKKLS
ncbi:TPA: hypothetical protein ACF3I9_004457 [Klebsiella aerogenes]